MRFEPLSGGAGCGQATLWERTIAVLDSGAVLVECGPMRMFIDASVEGRPRPDLGRSAAEAAVGFLEEVAAYWADLEAPAILIGRAPESSLVRTMWDACRAVGDPDLTPMAAVAGTIADATADVLVNLGATRVTVNNGGDIAVRLTRGDALAVGIRPDVDGREITHRLVVTADMNVGGICTSGLGGRSFTRGVASSATVFAPTAAIADAAATAVANATYVSAQSVVRRRADALDPDTDLASVEITVSVGDLAEPDIEQALEQGIVRANRLVDLGLILGACVVVKGRMAATDKISERLEPLTGKTSW